MTLEQGDKRAAKVVAQLAPYCDRVEVAGSIRRRRPNVNDVDIVALPKPGAEASLRARCKLNAAVIREGPQMMELCIGRDAALRRPDSRFHEGNTRCPYQWQIDLWIASPEAKDLLGTKPTNFGSLHLCRTGSKEFNIWLVTRAKLRGLHWNPHWGLFSGDQLLTSATEEAIFKALELEFIKPEERER